MIALFQYLTSLPINTISQISNLSPPLRPPPLLLGDYPELAQLQLPRLGTWMLNHPKWAPVRAGCSG